MSDSNNEDSSIHAPLGTTQTVLERKKSPPPLTYPLPNKKSKAERMRKESVEKRENMSKEDEKAKKEEDDDEEEFLPSPPPLPKFPTKPKPLAPNARWNQTIDESTHKSKSQPLPTKEESNKPSNKSHSLVKEDKKGSPLSGKPLPETRSLGRMVSDKEMTHSREKSESDLLPLKSHLYSNVSFTFLVCHVLLHKDEFIEATFISFLFVFAKPSTFLQILLELFKGERDIYSEETDRESCAKFEKEILEFSTEKLILKIQMSILELLGRYFNSDLVIEDIKADKDLCTPLLRALLKVDKITAASTVGLKKREISNIFSERWSGCKARVVEDPLSKSYKSSNSAATETNIFKIGSAEDLAMQMTNLEWLYYDNVTPRQMINKVLENHKDKIGSGDDRYDKVSSYISFIDKLAFFVCSEILIGRKHRAGSVDAVHMTEVELLFMIDLSFACLSHKNFSSVMAVATGFNNPSLSRLAFFWTKVHDEHTRRLGRIKMISENTAGYKKILSTVSSLGKNIPCLPSLAVSMKDLGGLDIQAGGKYVSKDGMIHFDKLLAMNKVIVDYLKFQKVPYSKPETVKEVVKENPKEGFRFSNIFFGSSTKLRGSSQSVAADEEEGVINFIKNPLIIKALHDKILSAKDPKDLFIMSKKQDMSLETAALANSLLASGFFDT